MNNDELLEQRRDYTANTLSRKQLQADPLQQFHHWLDDARQASIIDATAMVLSTSGDTGQPHSRVVLLKHADEDGFAWYTCQDSNKGHELAANPLASLLFYWRELERQVRIEGSVTRLDPAEAEDYFQSRPEGSRFSAVASRQSHPVENRAVLEKRVDELRQQYPDSKVPRPQRWGGYRLVPQRFEFWQGRADRLHDRFIYTAGNNRWQVNRLSP